MTENTEDKEVKDLIENTVVKTMENILDSNSNNPYPTAPDKDNAFKFFRYLLDLKDTSKAGNLSLQELGHLAHTVRAYQDIGSYAESEGLSKVENYVRNKGEIVLATSLSKKGFFPKLVVTQIKRDIKTDAPAGGDQNIKKNWIQKIMS